MDNNDLLMYGVLAAGLVVLWFALKALKRIALVLLVFVAVVGIALGLYLKFL